MGKASLILLGTVVLAASTTMAAAQGLADVAKAEEARRKTVKAPVKIYTNDSLKAPDGGEAPLPPAPAAASAPGGAAGQGTSPAKPAAPEANNAAAPASRDEKYWRERMSSARADLQRSQAFFDALQSQVQGLYAEFVATDDPVQRAVVEKKRLTALAEQDRVKADIEKYTKAITAIEDDARRSGVPPGWIR